MEEQRQRQEQGLFGGLGGSASCAGGAYRAQLAVALALMTVIPLLTMGYFLTSYVTPHVVTRENVIIVVALNVILALSGFLLLAKEVQRRTEALVGANASLQESEARFRTMFEDARDGMLMADVECMRFRAANEAMCRMLGYDVHELQVMSVSDIHPTEALERVRQAFGDQVAGHPLATDIPMKRKDGSVFLADVNAGMIEVDGTECLLGVFRDVTQRKDMEEQLVDTNVRLQSAMAQLKSREKQIIHHERLSALGRMASGIAHDFNNVLMPIVGLSEFTRQHPEVLKDQEEVVKILRQIEDAGRDAKYIVQRLRLIHKPRDVDEFAPLDISDIVRSSLELTKPRWREEMDAAGGHIEVRTELGKTPLVCGNETEIREVFMNLIMNAVDAMPEGGILTISSSTEDGIVLMEVRDNGMGMSQSDLQACLEPFFTTKGVAGTGLGLSMVHGIVERHHGGMEIESEPGRGTSVRIRLPVSEDKAVQHQKRKRAVPPPVRPLRVLIVDDESRSRRLLERFLRADSHAVVEAPTGEKAKEVLSQSGFDLVITDRAMPDISGDEVAVAAKAVNPGTPVILLTGFGEIMKDKGEKPDGVDRVMSKPVTQNDLRSVIADIIS